MSHKTCIKMLIVVYPHFPDDTPEWMDEGKKRPDFFLGSVLKYESTFSI